MRLCSQDTFLPSFSLVLLQTSSRLQSAAKPCRDERATPCSENNWNQFKDTHYHNAPCLPPSSSTMLPIPLHLSLLFILTSAFFYIFDRVPPELFKVAATIWVIQLGPISAILHRHMHTHEITHLPLCVLPDTARWERLHYRVELWPRFVCLAREERFYVCVCVCVCVCACGRETEEKEKDMSNWNEASLNVCVGISLHISMCMCVQWRGGGIGGLLVSQMTPLAIIKSTLFSSVWHIFKSPYVHIFLLNSGP